MKNTDFAFPDFSAGSLEFRFQNNEVCIYGTPEGLAWLSEMCLDLIKRRKNDHFHLEDYKRLTRESLPAAMAVFPGGK